MALRTGDLLRGTRGVYEITHRLKNPSLFKARILCSSTTPANWALVKTAETSMQKLRLHSEHLKYKLPEIAASPYFPTLLDAIKSEKNPSEPSSLVFEHLSTNLQSISPADFRANGDLAKIVSKGVLSALETVNKGGSVHTAVNPDNIFVTFDGRYGAIAKLGDLGLFIMNGSAGRPSLNPTYRAPEVYFGEMCCHNSDVWSLGITLADQISPLRIFGRRDRLLEDQTEEQRDAELMHPVTPAGKAIDISTEEGKDEFWRHMMIDHDPLGFHDSIIKGRWRKGLEHLPGPPVPQDLLDFIEYLLVVDPKKRPTAADALKHPYLSRRRY